MSGNFYPNISQFHTEKTEDLRKGGFFNDEIVKSLDTVYPRV